MGSTNAEFFTFLSEDMESSETSKSVSFLSVLFLHPKNVSNFREDPCPRDSRMESSSGELACTTCPWLLMANQAGSHWLQEGSAGVGVSFPDTPVLLGLTSLALITKAVITLFQHLLNKAGSTLSVQ